MRYTNLISDMKKNTVLFVILFTVFFSYPVSGQIIDKTLNNANLYKEYFFLDPLVFYDKDSTGGKLDLYIEILQQNLMFKKNSATGDFEANLDFVIAIKNSKNSIVVNQANTELVSIPKSDIKRIEDRSYFSLKQFNLPPEYYTINFTLRDKNNNTEYKKDVSFAVKERGIDNLFFSDVMLLSDVKAGAGKEKEITPLINNNVGSLKEFYFFFEVISKYDTAVNRAYYYKITDDKSKTLYQDTLTCEFLPGVNQIFQKIPTDNLYIGNFKLEVYDSRALHTGKYFTYKWGNIPVNMNDIDLAINQLVYVATEDELDKIKEGKTKEERQRRFVKFWRDKDPSPKTPKNELMMEYYNRIKIANERYSHYVEGWKTDMGMVFIIFGNPGNIERHPFDGNSKPYEIWDYYNVNRQFIFIDDSGYGDYRLLTPIWDERTKIRY